MPDAGAAGAFARHAVDVARRRAMRIEAPDHEPLDRLLATLEVEVSAVAVCEVEPGRRLAIEPMRDPKVHYVLRGAGTLRADEHELELAPGRFVVVPPARAHTMEVARPGANCRTDPGECVAFADGLIRLRAGTAGALVTACGVVRATYGGSLGLFDRLDRPAPAAPVHHETVRRAFEDMLRELSTPAIGTRAIVSALMKKCLVLVIRSELGAGAGGGWLRLLHDERMAAAVSAVLDDPCGRHTVERMAERAAMSRSAFGRRFSSAFGVAPIDFLAAVRLGQAAHLLARTRLPIKAVAESVGYASRSHFSRSFKRRHGLDPSAFRARHGGGPDGGHWRPMKALGSRPDGPAAGDAS